MTCVRQLLLVVISIAYLGGCTRDPSSEPDPSAPDAHTEPDSTLVADFCDATDPRIVPVEVVATPEAGEAPYLEALDSATTSIRVQVYMMGYGGILDRLKAKAAAGLDVAGR